MPRKPAPTPERPLRELTHEEKMTIRVERMELQMRENNMYIREIREAWPIFVESVAQQLALKLAPVVEKTIRESIKLPPSLPPPPEDY